MCEVEETFDKTCLVEVVGWTCEVDVTGRGNDHVE